MNAVAATQAPDSITTPDGLLIFPSQLYKGCAKLSADHVHLAADATDHALVYDPLTGAMTMFSPRSTAAAHSADIRSGSRGTDASKALTDS